MENGCYYVGVATTYEKRRGRIYVVLLSWGDGVLINLQYALQMACMSGSARTCCVIGGSDKKGEDMR